MSKRALQSPLDIPASEPWKNDAPKAFANKIVIPSLPSKPRKKSTPGAAVEWDKQVSPVAAKKPVLEAIGDDENTSPAQASTVKITDFIDEKESIMESVAFTIDEQSPGIEDMDRSPCLSDLGAEALVHGEHRSAADELLDDMFYSDSDSGSERNASFRRNDAGAEAVYTNKPMASDSDGDLADDSACDIANHRAKSTFESKKSQEPSISHEDYQKYIKIKEEITQERLHMEEQTAQHMLMKEQVDQERRQMEDRMVQQRKQIDQERRKADQERKQMEEKIDQDRKLMEAQVDQERIRMEKQIDLERIRLEAQTAQKCKEDEAQAAQKCKQMEEQATQRCTKIEEQIAQKRKQIDEQIEQDREQIDQERKEMGQTAQEFKQMKEQIDQERKEMEQTAQKCKQMEEQVGQEREQNDQERKQIDQERKQFDQERMQMEQAAQACKQTKEKIDEERKQVDQERKEMEKQMTQKRKEMEELDQQRKQFAQEREQMVQQRKQMEGQAAHKFKQMEEQIGQERRKMEAQTASLQETIAKLEAQSTPSTGKIAARVDASMDIETPNGQANMQSCIPQPSPSPSSPSSPSPSQLGLSSATSHPAQTPIAEIRGACLDFFDECQSASSMEIPYLFIKLISANAHGKGDVDIGQLYNSKASARASSRRITIMGAIGCNRDLGSHILNEDRRYWRYLAKIFQAQLVSSVTQF